MKKQSIKYDILFESVSKTKLGGKTCNQMIVEAVTDLNLTGIKKVLKERLDLAIKPGGEPYRPTLDDIKESMGSFCDSKKWLKKQTILYQKAYDFYNKVLNDIVVMNPLIRTYEFKPFNMCITIEVC